MLISKYLRSCTYKKFFVSFVFIIIFLSGACIGDSQASTLLIDDFESRDIGKISRERPRLPREASEYCISRYVKSNRNNISTTALSIHYKVSLESSVAIFIKLGNINLKSYNSLEFYIKGGKTYPEIVKLMFINSKGEAGAYYFKGTDKNEWKKITVPFSELKGITQTSLLKEIGIVFENTATANHSGNILIDDIYLSHISGSVSKEIVMPEKQLIQELTAPGLIAALPADEFLEAISKRIFSYFWNETDKWTGFVKDRNTLDSPSSIAATGFGLTALCIADSRAWISRAEAIERVKKTLVSIIDTAEHNKGFLYHFIDARTGRRAWDCEVSSVDTALLLSGVIVCKEYFNDREIKDLCNEIYSRVNWKSMMEPESKALYMGWDPEDGFNEYILWDMFGEEMSMYMLGIGADKNSLPQESWHSFKRLKKTYKDFTYVFCTSESMFTYLYSHAYIDFRDKHDKYADYWINSMNAIGANIAFCDEHKNKYKAYKEGYWGISAGDGPSGYKNYGALLFSHDGTIPPYAMCAAIPFIPEKAIANLRKLLTKYGERVWNNDYGFVSAFNLDRNWFSGEHIGIDLGISLLMIENYRSEFVWQQFMKNKNIKNAMKIVGFEYGSSASGVKVKKIDEIKPKDEIREYYAGKTRTPYAVRKRNLVKFDDKYDIESGVIEGSMDLASTFGFSWDSENLYLIIEVMDDRVLANRKREELYKDDCVELFIADSDYFVWGDDRNFQIGLSPTGPDGFPMRYSFFQKEDPGDNVVLSVKNMPSGYKMEVAVKWSYLKIIPERKKSFGMSIAVHDVDKPGETGTKLNWSYTKSPEGIKLGKITLK